LTLQRDRNPNVITSHKRALPVAAMRSERSARFSPKVDEIFRWTKAAGAVLRLLILPAAINRHWTTDRDVPEGGNTCRIFSIEPVNGRVLWRADLLNIKCRPSSP
jgi:hypothetical protein